MKIVSKLLIMPTVAFVLAGCSSQPTQPTASPAENTTEMAAPANNGALGKASEESAIPVALANFKFSPNTLSAKAGLVLVVKLTDAEGSHDFNIDELSIKSGILGKGDSKFVEIKIPADAVGKSYEYYCSVGNHRQMGMVGKLTIE